MSELLAALIGALVGGFATFGASWWQTKRVLEHETAQAREAAAEERAATRENLARSSALDLLMLLGELQVLVPTLRRGIDLQRLMRGQAQDDPPGAVLDAVRRYANSTGLLLPQPLQQATRNVLMLAEQLRSGDVHPHVKSDALGDTTVDVDAERLFERASADMAEFLSYVRRSVARFVDDGTLLPPADPPVLGRIDMSVWPAPS